MSNKPSNLKSEIKFKKQFGNFIVTIQGKELEYIQIKTTSGNWSQRVSLEDGYGQILKSVIKTEDEANEKYLKTLITTSYISSYGVKDYKFMEDLIEAYNKMHERLSEPKEITEEEELEIINKIKEEQQNGNY